MYPVEKNIARSIDILRHLRIISHQAQGDEILSQLGEKQTKATVVSWLNAHTMMVAKADNALSENLLKADFLMRDGVGISLLLRLLGRNPGLNMNGTDLIPRILHQYAGKSIAILGTTEPYLSKAAQAIEKFGCTIVLRMDGFQDKEHYARQLAEHNVDLVLLAMGVPKQEKIAAYLAEKIERPMLILNGGAILDFMANRFPRAPMLWRRLGLEWMYRLIQEPDRLWRRYTVGGIGFALYAAKLFLYERQSAALSSAGPRGDR